MNPVYKFNLYVETPDFQRHAVAFDLCAFVAREYKWEPYDECTDAVTALIAGGVTLGAAQRIDVDREAMAKELAENLTGHIMKILKSRDLKNGYKQ